MEWEGPSELLFLRDDVPLGGERTINGYDNVCEKYQWARRVALDGGYDALLTVEADMIVPEHTLARLSQVDADVAYGLYASRHGRTQWVCATELGKMTAQWLSQDHYRAKQAWGQVIESGGVGMGCTFIRRRVLEAIPFRREPGLLANDWYFALDVREAGYRQVHDLGVVCGHITGKPSPRIIWPDVTARNLVRVEYMEPGLPVEPEPEDEPRVATTVQELAALAVEV